MLFSRPRIEGPRPEIKHPRETHEQNPDTSVQSAAAAAAAAAPLTHKVRSAETHDRHSQKKKSGKIKHRSNVSSATNQASPQPSVGTAHVPEKSSSRLHLSELNRCFQDSNFGKTAASSRSSHRSSTATAPLYVLRSHTSERFSCSRCPRRQTRAARPKRR